MVNLNGIVRARMCTRLYLVGLVGALLTGTVTSSRLPEGHGGRSTLVIWLKILFLLKTPSQGTHGLPYRGP